MEFLCLRNDSNSSRAAASQSGTLSTIAKVVATPTPQLHPKDYMEANVSHSEFVMQPGAPEDPVFVHLERLLSVAGPRDVSPGPVEEKQ